MNRLLPLIFIPSCSLAISFSSTIHAQIVPDRTLPNNSLVTPQGNVSEITGGTTVGGNLFHSFEQFSVTTGGEAFFNHAANIENIISRVTGQSVSNIDGLIRANGQANLFLLNPNGILFGANASLNIGGSFVASSASSLRFRDGSEFSTELSTPTLLTISTPIGLQMGTNPGSISDRGARLAVPFHQTLALVGGDIFIEGGNLTASGGRIELGSMGAGSLVNLSPTFSGWSLDYTGVEIFDDIRLTRSTTVDVSGNGSGDVRLQGRQIALRDGSSIRGVTLGNEMGKTVRLQASESVEIVDLSAIAVFAGATATENGGNLTINTNRLLVTNGSQIVTGTIGEANAGDININAQEIKVFGLTANPVFAPSLIGTTVFPQASGNSGNVVLNTGDLFLADGGQVGAVTTGSGNAGNVTITASNIEVRGALPDYSTFSVLLSTVLPGATGNGGNLTIATQRLLVADGAQVGTGTFGAGKAGDVNITADEITVTGSSPQSLSTITTVVTPEATGQGGDLNIETERLQVAADGAISAGTFGVGDSGNLTIAAKEEIVIDDGFIGTTVFPDGIFPTEQAVFSTGRGGNVSIETKRLQIINSGAISTGTFGAGDSGNLIVRASESIEISGVVNTSDDSFPSGLFSSAEEGSIGNGGNVIIETPTLRIFDGAQIRASTNGIGRAGNIIIDTRSLELAGVSPEEAFPSQIDAASNGDGTAGSIQIRATDLTVRDGAAISVSGEGLGGAGNLVINSDRIQLNNKAKIQAEVAGGDRGNININSDRLILRRGSQITTNARGNSSGGNIAIDSDFLIAVPTENSDITANAQQNFGGRVTISTQGLFGITPRQKLTPLSDITATSELGSQFSGVVQIIDPNVDPTTDTVKLPSEIIDASNQIVAGCAADAGNTFVITGRGGVPENPSQSLTGQSVWQDWRGDEGRGLIEGRGQEAEGRREEDGRGQRAEGRREEEGTRHSALGTREEGRGNKKVVQSSLITHQLSVPLGVSLSSLTSPLPFTASPRPRVSSSLIVEAQGWITRDDGKVQLVANHSQGSWQEKVSCRSF